MAVNNNFYKTINQLMGYHANGGTNAIVDYSSFIDAGRQITALTGQDLMNNFVSALMNKIGLTINTFRSYDGRYKSLIRGKLEYGDVIEIITNKFYDTQAAGFVNLTNGTSLDQWEVHKPDVDVNYYVKPNAYTIPITIQRDQLDKAWSNPAAMDNFIQGTIGYVVNSSEFARESGRIGLVANAIVDILHVDNQEGQPNSGKGELNTPAISYNLWKIGRYHGILQPEDTLDKALVKPEFVRLAVQCILNASALMSTVNSKMNLAGIRTFTPEDSKHMFIHSALASAMRSWLYISPDGIPVSAPKLTGYIEVPNWQNEEYPFDVVKGTMDTPEGSDKTTAKGVLAFLCDEYALGEYVRSESMDGTPYNARMKTFNYWYNVETKLVENTNANMAVFFYEITE